MTIRQRRRWRISKGKASFHHTVTLFHTSLHCGGFGAVCGVSREVWRVSGFCLQHCFVAHRCNSVAFQCCRSHWCRSRSFITALQPILKSYQVFPSLCCIYTLKDWNITLAQCTLVQLAVCHLGFGFVVKLALGTEKQQRAVSPNLLWLWQQQMPTVLHRAFNTCTTEPFLWLSISFVVVTAETWVKLHRAWNLHLAEVKGRLRSRTF